MATTRDATLDLPLDDIADNCDTETVCSSEPANHAGISSVALADTTLTVGAGNGDYTKGDGDVSGRKVTVAAQADVPIDATGSGNFVALHDATDLYHTADGDGQALSSGGTVDIGAFDIEFEDPA